MQPKGAVNQAKAAMCNLQKDPAVYMTKHKFYRKNNNDKYLKLWIFQFKKLDK